MSIDERLTRKAAAALSRRHFLSVLGRSVAALGLVLVGGARVAVDPAYAASRCCPTPDCGNCRFQGSQCPTGWSKIATTNCCLNSCSWTCSKCRKDANPDMGSICWCAHEDFHDCGGGHCITAPQP